MKNFIEIGQISNKGSKFYLHGQETVSDGILEVFQKSSSDSISFDKASGNFGFPSTTLKEFLKNDAADESLTAQSVYVGNFDSEFSNQFYNSMFDATNVLGLDFSAYCKSAGKVSRFFTES